MKDIDTGSLNFPKIDNFRVIQISPIININVESSAQLEHLLYEIRSLINHSTEGWVFKMPKPPEPK